MKRILLVLVIALGVVSLLPAAPLTIAELQTDFQTFSDAVAGTLTSTATLSGLSWSPAYIGQFPHFGVGLSAGAGLIPYSSVSPILSALGVTLPAGMQMLQTYGIPLPGAAVDARIGGFILPFDIGLKFGYLPPQLQSLLGSVKVDFLMAGGDVRLALLKDEGLVPALSVGVGYTYFKGAVGLPGVVPGQTIDISQPMNLYYSTSGQTYSLFISPADFNFGWQTNVIEAKVQLSKQLLFFVPSVGLSVAYGRTSAGGGVASTVSTSGNTNMTDVQAAFAKAGYSAPSATGVNVSSGSNGYSVRAFGGVSLALLFLNLDLNASYNILTQSLGGGVNLRLQF